MYRRMRMTISEILWNDAPRSMSELEAMDKRNTLRAAIAPLPDPVKVRSLFRFVDGSMASAFGMLGLQPVLEQGRVYDLPKAVITSCLNSGAILQLVEDEHD